MRLVMLLCGGLVTHTNDVALDAFSECGYQTALPAGSSVSCTNDVALDAFSECRNRTAYL